MLKAVSGKKSRMNLFRCSQILMNAQSQRTVQMSTNALKMRTVRTRIRVTLSGVTPVSADEDFQAMEYPVTQVKTRTSYYERIKLGKV